MEKQVVNLTIFLIKEHITDLKDCLKAPDTLSSSNIKHEYGMEGTIFYCDSKRKPPRWKAYLETLSERSLDISKDKKFIHVKNKGQSAQLSHLFSQGKVSAECFASDEKYRKQVSDLVIAKFGDTIFDYTAKPQSNEFEVVYAIIDEKESSLEDKLPFFSKVNLMLAVQELDRMHFSCSVCLVKKET